MRQTLLTLAFILPAGLALAQSPEEAAQARKAYFDDLGKQMGVLAGMARGKSDYDAASASAAGAEIAKLAHQDVAALWVPGSSKEDLPGKTRALPAGFSDTAGLNTHIESLRKAADEIARVAGSGLDQLRPAVGPLGASCKACHDDYRAKDF